jgi:predicted DsbA family dithiol-disulfide isomerase
MSATVEVYADVVCPFAYIGLKRLLAHRDRIGRSDVRFRVKSWPLELVNGEPVDAHFILEEIDEVAPQVAPDLFGGFDLESFPGTSIPALALTRAAYEHSDALGERVAMALREALFEEGLDISDPDVLEAIARSHGLDDMGSREDVVDDYESGVERGVVGSPHFFTATASMFCPVLDIRRVDGKLHVKVDEAATRAIIDACFGTADSP